MENSRAECTIEKVPKRRDNVPNIVAYRDKDGKLQTSLPIEQSNSKKSESFRSKVARRIYAFFPIIDWLPEYDVKKNIVGDIVGGLTIGVMHTTQGIAYALLARVPPVYGLYTSFFPALVYAIFGTSRHASVGSFAIVALMCGVTVDRVLTSNQQSSLRHNGTNELEWDDSENNNNHSLAPLPPPPPSYTAVEIASTLTVMQGIITLLTAICCLEFITKYFSDTLVSGFTTGAAVHVAVGQLNVVLGLNVKSVGNMHIFERIANIVMKIPEANICVVITSLCSMVFIYIGKEFIDPVVKQRSKAIQIPYELILIITGIIVSHTMKLRDGFHVRCVGEIPVGLPKPQMPRFDLVSQCLPDALAIAALSIAIHISMAKMLAKKLKYKVNSGQELYAFGMMGIISGLFTCYPSSTSMGRTLVSVATGSQTQLASLVSCMFLMGIILFFGPLFYTLPMCILAAIILMALRKMFQKGDELKRLWKVSKTDFLIWVIAFTSTVAIGVIYGLAISMGFAILMVVVRTHLPMNCDSVTDGGYQAKKVTDVEETHPTTCWHTASDMLVHRLSSSLSFANVDSFRDSFQKTFAEWSQQKDTNVASIEQPNQKYVVLDFARVNFVDVSGVDALNDMIKEMEKQQMTNIFFLNTNARVTKMLQLEGLEKHLHSTRDIPI